MREIKFRGKRIDDGRWVYGQYFTTPLTDENSGTSPDAGWFFLSGEQRHCIVQDGVSFVIDVETLGQFTGLKDKNGKDIYERDIVKNRGYEELCIVEFYQGQYIGRYKPQDCFYQLDESLKVTEQRELYYIGLSFYVKERNSIEVIGNVYENSELLNN